MVVALVVLKTVLFQVVQVLKVGDPVVPGVLGKVFELVVTACGSCDPARLRHRARDTRVRVSCIRGLPLRTL